MPNLYHYRYRGRARRVIGPLSLDVDIDLGFRINIALPVRLDALAQPLPEHRDQVVDLVQAWLAAHHNQFTVETIKDTQEKFGRYLAIITAGDDGTELNQYLLSTDLVRPLGEPPPGATANAT